jgi:adenosylmethionine-8-amino-7-oxononanoate aminotransferase
LAAGRLLQRIREICDKYNVLFAADEVITSFGGEDVRLAALGVGRRGSFAKAITSGYFPRGGIGVNDKIASAFDTAQAIWMHAFTYSSHPVGCAVALAMLDIVERENFPQQAAEKGKYFLGRLREALAGHPHVGDVRGLGLMCAIEYVRDKSTKEEFAPEEKVGHRVHVAAQERGLFSRLRGDVFCLAPPIITTEKQLDRIVEIMQGATEAVLGK